MAPTIRAVGSVCTLAHGYGRYRATCLSDGAADSTLQSLLRGVIHSSSRAANASEGPYGKAWFKCGTDGVWQGEIRCMHDPLLRELVKLLPELELVPAYDNESDTCSWTQPATGNTTHTTEPDRKTQSDPQQYKVFSVALLRTAAITLKDGVFYRKLLFAFPFAGAVQRAEHVQRAGLTLSPPCGLKGHMAIPHDLNTTRIIRKVSASGLPVLALVNGKPSDKRIAYNDALRTKVRDPSQNVWLPLSHSGLLARHQRPWMRSCLQCDNGFDVQNTHRNLTANNSATWSSYNWVTGSDAGSVAWRGSPHPGCSDLCHDSSTISNSSNELFKFKVKLCNDFCVRSCVQDASDNCTQCLSGDLVGGPYPKPCSATPCSTKCGWMPGWEVPQAMQARVPVASSYSGTDAFLATDAAMHIKVWDVEKQSPSSPAPDNWRRKAADDTFAWAGTSSLGATVQHADSGRGDLLQANVWSTVVQYTDTYQGRTDAWRACGPGNLCECYPSSMYTAAELEDPGISRNLTTGEPRLDMFVVDCSQGFMIELPGMPRPRLLQQKDAPAMVTLHLVTTCDQCANHTQNLCQLAELRTVSIGTGGSDGDIGPTLAEVGCGVLDLHYRVWRNSQGPCYVAVASTYHAPDTLQESFHVVFNGGCGGPRTEALSVRRDLVTQTAAEALEQCTSQCSMESNCNAFELSSGPEAEEGAEYGTRGTPNAHHPS